MNLRDEWRERVAEALPCTPRCYPATRSGHSNGCTRSRHTTADHLLAPGGVVAGIVAEVVKRELREAGDRAFDAGRRHAEAEVRARVEAVCAEWDAETNLAPEAYHLVDDVRAALGDPISTPVRRSEPLSGSGEGAGPSDGAEGVERGEG